MLSSRSLVGPCKARLIIFLSKSMGIKLAIFFWIIELGTLIFKA